eukprot:6149484-Prymnesium_polylepis.2
MTPPARTTTAQGLLKHLEIVASDIETMPALRASEEASTKKWINSARVATVHERDMLILHR